MNKNPMGVTQRRWFGRPLIVAAVLFVVVLVGIAGNLEQWLWMRQLDYAGIFWTLLSVQWAMFCSAFVVAFLYLWINLRQAAKNSAALRAGGPWSLDVLRQPFYPESTQPRRQRLSCLPGF